LNALPRTPAGQLRPADRPADRYLAGQPASQPAARQAAATISAPPWIHLDAAPLWPPSGCGEIVLRRAAARTLAICALQVGRPTVSLLAPSPPVRASARPSSRPAGQPLEALRQPPELKRRPTAGAGKVWARKY